MRSVWGERYGFTDCYNQLNKCNKKTWPDRKHLSLALRYNIHWVLAMHLCFMVGMCRNTIWNKLKHVQIIKAHTQFVVIWCNMNDHGINQVSHFLSHILYIPLQSWYPPRNWVSLTVSQIQVFVLNLISETLSDSGQGHPR